MDPNPFAGTSRSWRRAWLVAALCEIVVATPVFVGYFGLGPLGGRGADSPLLVYAAVILQFPASLFVGPVEAWASGYGLPQPWAMTIAASLCVLTETALLAILFRMPWRVTARVGNGI